VTAIIALFAYIATVPAANWMIGHVGRCIPDGPCVIPVGFGLTAPSGVLMVGLALVLRDLVQRRFGAPWSLVCIASGTVLSLLVAPPAIAIASGTAFLFSELADFAVFTPLWRRGLVVAVVASCLAGAIVDSAIFLWLAFGSLDLITGQVVGKMWVTIAALPVIRSMRRQPPERRRAS
jgi:uncharacterized PurR-regulated membrane protein YhhQ (DUF165 family)